jgi:nucleoside-triphosphatase THEP1
MYKDLKEFYWWPNMKEGDNRICVKIWDVSTGEDRTLKASGGIATATNSKMKMGKYSH